MKNELSTKANNKTVTLFRKAGTKIKESGWFPWIVGTVSVAYCVIATFLLIKGNEIEGTIGLIDTLYIAPVTLVFSALLWMREKKTELDLRKKEKAILNTEADERCVAILVNIGCEHKANELVENINANPDIDYLKPLVVDSEPLYNHKDFNFSVFVKVPGKGEFKCSYRTSKEMGSRIITLTGPSVPTGPDSSKERFAYISAYQDALLQLRDKLADSVRHIHLFFAGPGPLVGIITAMFKNQKMIYSYVYTNSKYYPLQPLHAAGGTSRIIEADKNKTFVNFTNHPSEKWSEKQRVAAERFGRIVDIPFPAVMPDASSEQIEGLAEEETAKIVAQNPAAVLCQGEMTLTYEVVKCLKASGIDVYAACSDRVTKEFVQEDGTTKRESVFDFVGFREY